MGWYLFAVILVCFYIISHIIEISHLEEIKIREGFYRDKVKLTNLKTLPVGVKAKEVFLCKGSVVIGANYYRRFIASLKQIIGGHLKIMEGIVDRAYREATLRMIRDAYGKGAVLIINVRYETTCIGRTDRRGKQEGSMLEVFAYGTAVVA